MNYILNSAVITAPGTYRYNRVSVSDAIVWLKKHSWESAIGYEETALALQKITAVKIPVNRSVITMNPGEEALVFRLVFPKGYRPDPDQKGKLGVDFIRMNCEIGILRRIE